MAKEVHGPHPLHPRLVLDKKPPKGATLIEGFPGLGLVGTIATGFLLDHLKCEKIGAYYFEEPPATLAVHGCQIVDPVGIFYNKEHHIVVVHAITSAAAMEFRAADLILELSRQVGASQVITLEGVGSQEGNTTRGFFYTDNPAMRKTMEKIGADCLGEGIIVGVTAAILMRRQLPVLALFAETHSKMPDSRAAAKLIEVLDRLLDLSVNYDPLLKQAAEFEKKLKGMLEQSMKTHELKEQKEVRYIG